jgi:2-amino-4-hydroxy-6-hydroxymethyldihydropteridine diphosphokinase
VVDSAKSKLPIPNVPVQCLISLGSNLGDRGAVLHDAAIRIRAVSGISDLRFSRLYQTPPIGGPDGQEPFFNAVAAFDTTRSAAEILSLLQSMENELGRVRRDRWGARKVDLDVVLHGPLIGGSALLVVPHPRYTARRFVLMPACDVAPDYVDPRFGWSLERLAHHIEQGVPSLCLLGGEADQQQKIADRLRAFGDIAVICHPAKTWTIPVVANSPAPVARNIVSHPSQTVEPRPDRRWVEIDGTPPTSDHADDPSSARLIARMYLSDGKPIWPVPHRLWTSGRHYPEYSLEVTDLDWAAAELRSALDSMCCPCQPVADPHEWAA